MAYSDITELVKKYAALNNVPEDLAWKLIRQESGGNKMATSPKGASGYMQLMPATAKEMGVTDIYDPEQNIMGGMKYIGQQLKDFGDPRLALAAYNAGPAAVRKYGGVPPYAETQNYVKSIMGESSPNPRRPQSPMGTDTFGSVAANDLSKTSTSQPPIKPFVPRPKRTFMGQLGDFLGNVNPVFGALKVLFDKKDKPTDVASTQVAGAPIV